MHPQSLRTLTALLCQDLLANPGDTDLAHITLNIPLHSVSALFRVGYDGSFFQTAFVLTQTHCVGAIVMEPDGQYWQELEMSSWAVLDQYRELFSVPPDPRITTWRSMEDYAREFPEKLSPEDLAWPMLIFQFQSVEIVSQHPEKDVQEVFNGSGRELCDSQDLDRLLAGL